MMKEVLKQQWFHLFPQLGIDCIGYINTTNRHPRRKGVSYWILVLMEKGDRTLYVNGEAVHIGTRDFLLLPPQTVQEPLENDTHSAWYVHFYVQGSQTIPGTQIAADKIILPMRGHLPAEFDCCSYMNYIYMQARKPYVGKMFTTVQLQALLSIISLHAQKDKLQRHDSLGEKMLTFIQMHADSCLSAQDYEAEFRLSYHRLGELFKKQYGCTLKQYHQHTRMQHAAVLLLNGKTLEQTAALCGYEDYYYFIKCFKKEHGISPHKYQKDNGLSAKP